MEAVNVPVFAHLINRFAPEHNDFNIIRKNLRDLGLFLVFSGASIVLGAIPECSDNSKNIFMAFAIFVMGMMLVWLSLVVNFHHSPVVDGSGSSQFLGFGSRPFSSNLFLRMFALHFWMDDFGFKSDSYDLKFNY